MIFLSIATDGDYYLLPFGADETRRVLTVRPETTIDIELNDDAATVTIGYEDSTGAFKAYTDGDITTVGGAEINHGIGVKLMVNVSGIATEPVNLAYSSS